MVLTKDGLHAEMATAMVLAALIPPLEEKAPESMMLRELREALRCAHPACFDEKNNPELHKAFREGFGRDPQGLLARLRLPTTPVSEPAPAGSALSVGGAAGTLTPDEVATLRALLQKSAPPVEPGDTTTGTVEGA